jgi:hypothetical protein
MKLIVALLFTFLSHPGLSFIYKNEHRYADFLSKHGDLGVEGSGHGLKLKVTEESIHGLVRQLVGEIEGDREDENGLDELDERLFTFGDDTEFDAFDDVDLEAMEKDEDEPKEPSVEVEDDNTKVSTKFTKWACSYSRSMSVSGNRTKSFWKAHESVKHQGSLDTNVQGSLDTKVTSRSSGSVASLVNTTLFIQGKKYQARATAKTKVSGNGEEKKAGKVTPRIVSTGNSGASISVNTENKTIQLQVNSKTGSETFPAPFGIYLTLFESSWQLGTGGDVQAGASGKVRGEITSHLVYSKKGKSLTKVTMRGYAMTEGKNYCSVSMFKIWSHVWIKPISGTEDDGNVSTSEADISENPEADIKVAVSTYSKGRVYSKTVAQKIKVFSGAGAVAYEKDIVTLPRGHGEKGLNWAVKHLLERRLTAWRKPGSNLLDI